jgi:hypothetical protein
MHTQQGLNAAERLALIEAGLAGQLLSTPSRRPEPTASELAEQQGLARLVKHARHPNSDVSLPAIEELIKVGRSDLIGIG